MDKFKLYLGFLLILSACGGMSDASKVLRNEKIKTTDEFLVKKREPSVLPPNYNEIPEPDTLNRSRNLSEDDKIKKILEVQSKNTEGKNKTSSVEELIIDKIGK